MILGINGKIGSGKDTVGKIIQYLTLGEEFSKTNGDILADLEYNGYYANKSNFRIKKFADKLKDIVCMLLGCTREQLEDREFKEKELGEEWWYWENSFGKRINYLDNITYDSTVKDGLTSRKLVKLTPRLLLQLLGTECGRQIIHPNIWVNALMSEYKHYKKGIAYNLETDKNLFEYYLHKECKHCKKSYGGYKRQYLCMDCIEDDSIQFYPNWIITDMRFPNELEAVKKKNGIAIRVNRKSFKWIDPDEYEIQTGKKVERVAEHESEKALNDAEFDYTIENDGTLLELVEKVRKILIKEKIINE